MGFRITNKHIYIYIQYFAALYHGHKTHSPLMHHHKRAFISWSHRLWHWCEPFFTSKPYTDLFAVLKTQGLCKSYHFTPSKYTLMHSIPAAIMYYRTLIKLVINNTAGYFSCNNIMRSIRMCSLCMVCISLRSCKNKIWCTKIIRMPNYNT